MKLRKEFGQHFLVNEEICTDIVQLLTNLPNSLSMPLVEVGPGGGAITKYLVKEPFPNYTLIEIDTEKVHYLIKTFDINPNQIINIDFLSMDIPYQEPFNIIGNFPYNISTQIMFKVFDWKDQVKYVVGMFQKEVAVRIASKEGNKDYGILSVLMQAFFDISYNFDVLPNAFNPPPKVDSGVITLINNNNKFNIQYPLKFLKLIKASFAMRRKTLRNNLKGFIPTDRLEDDFFSKRAEQVSVESFVALYKSIYEAN